MPKQAMPDLEWLTLDEAAVRLSPVIGHQITPSAVLRLALEERLTLSVYFPTAVFAREVIKEETNEPWIGNNVRRVGQWPPLLWGTLVDGYTLTFLEELQFLRGVFDAPLIGIERLEAEQLVAKSVGAADHTRSLYQREGCFVTDGSGRLFQLMRDHAEDFAINPDYRPAERLPEGTVFVIRTRAISDFERATTQEQSPRITTGLLKLVLGMALDSYAYDPRAPRGNTVPRIVDALARHGIEIDPKTVRHWLTEAAEEIEHIPKESD